VQNALLLIYSFSKRSVAVRRASQLSSSMTEKPELHCTGYSWAADEKLLPTWRAGNSPWIAAAGIMSNWRVTRNCDSETRGAAVYTIHYALATVHCSNLFCVAPLFAQRQSASFDWDSPLISFHYLQLRKLLTHLFTLHARKTMEDVTGSVGIKNAWYFSYISA